MDLIRTAIAKPVTVAVGVILVVMFGLIGLGEIPIQLTPTIDRPVLSVTTSWTGRSPQEMADEITKEQEERLKNVPNLKSMRSVSFEGQTQITLEFYVGTDKAEAKQDVADALRQVPDYPDEVDEPTITESANAAENSIAWVMIDLDPVHAAKHPEFDITTLFHGIDRDVKPFLERVDGVAQVNVFGGREREVRVLLDPVRMAQRGVSHREVIDALRNENRDISGGTIAEGKRDYPVRVVGQFENERDILDTIVAYRSDPESRGGAARPIFVRDLGTVEIGFDKKRGFVRENGIPVLAMNVLRQDGSNVMTVMRGVLDRLESIRRDILPTLDPVVGDHLRMRQVYDETTYISSSISLVRTNVWIGGSLAILALLIFLRSLRSTLVVALAIPISVIGTFLVMLVTGRTLNVVSLAGLAFATGMVVDNAVVVLENIDRRRSMGDPASVAVYRGAKEVWGAILAATLTTVAVFIPILTVQEEAGQIFFDLALALAVSVLFSLVVSITVVPAAANLVHGAVETDADWHKHPVKTLLGLAPAMRRGVNAVGETMYWLMTGWRGWTLRPALIIGLTLASIFGAIALAPPLDYLPSGNQNLVFGGMSIPPGLSVDELTEYSKRIEAYVDPYVQVDGDDPAALAALPPIQQAWGPGEPFDPVGVEHFFVGAFGGGMFVGATSQDPQVVIPIGMLISNAMQQIPAAYGGAAQASIFGQGISGGNSIDIEVMGPSLDRVTQAAVMMQGLLGATYGFANVNAEPSNFNLEQLEYQVRLTDAGRELGLTTSDVGLAVRGLFDGAYAGDFIYQGRKIDLVVLPLGGRLEFKEELGSVPVSTPAGKIVPIDSLVRTELATTPQSILRIEELPAVTLRLTPPTGVAIEQVMHDLEAQVIEPARVAGVIDSSMRVQLEGSAAKLDEVKASLLGAASPEPPALGARILQGLALVVLALGVGVALLGLVRSRRNGEQRARLIYGAFGALLLGAVLGGLMLTLGQHPHLAGARFIWALAVTFLLMAALFESFLFPFVIMFSVPLAVVGGFGALRIVHVWTASNPTIAPQQLDVLTMIGFVILIGVVVNNAILIVQQSLNFMDPSRVPGFEHEPRIPALRAIAEAVKTRCRPIFMTTCTTVGGGLPLILAPGSGSEMYRGLGAVVVGGLFVSAFFTLIMVPMLFSLVLQMRDGVRAIFERGEAGSAGSGDQWARAGAQGPAEAFEAVEQPEREVEPELEPAMVRGIDPAPA